LLLLVAAAKPKPTATAALEAIHPAIHAARIIKPITTAATTTPTIPSVPVTIASPAAAATAAASIVLPRRPLVVICQHVVRLLRRHEFRLAPGYAVGVRRLGNALVRASHLCHAGAL